MEWVETTAKTIEDAKEQALDQLGVAEDDVEFEILEEPKAGLFGLIRGEARLRARIRPTEVRPKVERRRGGRTRGQGGRETSADDRSAVATDVAEPAGDSAPDAAGEETAPRGGRRGNGGGGRGGSGRNAGRNTDRNTDRNADRDDRGDTSAEPVDPAAVGAAAVAFMEGLVTAFGKTATVELEIDGTELEVRVDGEDLGLLIGPGGRTLLAIQDLVRVAAQRRLGDHETRLRVDVAGYRERRRAALERFARSVAEQVIETASPRSLEPMPSADRKVVHDVLVTIDGVTSHSEGDDPNRRVVVTPA